MDFNTFKKILFTGITSVGCGVIIGLLFAPDKGSKTRQRITRKGDEYLKDMKNDLAEIRRFLLNEGDAKRDAEKDAGSTGIKPSSKSAFESWTKDELYELAKEKDIAGRSSMNKAELIEALRNS